MPDEKPPPLNVFKLIAESFKNKDRLAAKKAAKRPTLANRFRRRIR